MVAQLCAAAKESVPDRLVLESPFNNIPDVFRNHPLTVVRTVYKLNNSYKGSIEEILFLQQSLRFVADVSTIVLRRPVLHRATRNEQRHV